MLPITDIRWFIRSARTELHLSNYHMNRSRWHDCRRLQEIEADYAQVYLERGQRVLKRLAQALEPEPDILDNTVFEKFDREDRFSQRFYDI